MKIKLNTLLVSGLLFAVAQLNLHAQLVPDGGAGSVSTAIDLLPSNLIVGTNGGNTRLKIMGPNGAVTNATGYIGYNASSSGNTVTVEYSGANWHNTGDLNLGNQGSGNSVLITSGATVATGANLRAGYGGSSNSVIIRNGSTVTSVFTAGAGLLAGSHGNQIIVSDPGSRLLPGTQIQIGYQGWGNLLLITNGASVHNPQTGFLGFDAAASNNLAVVTGSGSVWTNDQSLILGDLGPGNELRLQDGGLALSVGATILGEQAGSANNLLHLAGGVLDVGTILDVRRGTLQLDSGTATVGKLLATNGADSSIVFNGGTLTVSNSTVNNGALFVVGNGSSSATLQLLGHGLHTFNNGLTIATNAGLIMEIAKNGTTLTNDLIQVPGSLTNNGTLTVTNLGPTALAAGDRFRLFNAGSYTGPGFANVNLPNLPAGLLWTNRLLVDGSIAVVSNTAPFYTVPIAGLPGIEGSSMAWGDYDNDGRLDFLIAGTTDGSSAGAIFQLWRNTGSGFTNVTATAFPDGAPPGVYYNSVVWGDYDNDGRLDFLLTGANSSGNPIFQLWRNTGSGFANVTAPAFPDGAPPGVVSSSVAWGDYDNDGHLDFVITGQNSSNNPVSQLWRNTGSGFANVTATVAPGLPGVEYSSVAWGDYDNDGRLDFLLTGETRSGVVSQLWRNTGSGFTNVPIAGLPGVYGSSVAWGDYDNDGRLDFLISGANSSGNGISQLWRNTGSGFTNVPIAGLPGVEGSSVAWGDYDNDGRLDFLFTGSTIGGARFSQLWRNTGSGFTNMPIASLPRVGESSVAWGDYDNDGRLDFLVTGLNSGGSVSQLWRNNTPVTNAPPAAPTGLVTSVSLMNAVLVWNPATDDHTPPAGLSYNLRIGTTPGGADVVSPQAAPNGFRVLPALGNAQSSANTLVTLPPGTYYWSVQAVDGAFAGSPFAPDQQFTISSTIPPLGDANGDGVVDQSELDTVISNYWQTSPPNVQTVSSPSNTDFQFTLNNLSDLNFNVLATTNLALPLMDWTNIGTAKLTYQFNDRDATNYPQRFYQLVWP